MAFEKRLDISEFIEYTTAKGKLTRLSFLLSNAIKIAVEELEAGEVSRATTILKHVMKEVENEI